MIHSKSKHDNTNYKLLSYALRNDMSVAADRINHAYQLLLERKSKGYTVSPTVLWYCEQSLIDLDRPDLVTTCFGEPLPAKGENLIENTTEALGKELERLQSMFASLSPFHQYHIMMDDITKEIHRRKGGE